MYRILRKVANNQLIILNEFRKSKTTLKSWRHLYFFEIIESFWNDGDFALSLGKNKHSAYAIYPARTMMEKLLKIEWVSKMKAQEEQDIVAKKELLKSCLISYRKDIDNGRTGADFKKHYNEINDIGLPAIDAVKMKDLEAFPSYEEMCIKSRLPGSSQLYYNYRMLSGLPHGNLLSVFMKQHKQGDGNDEYIQAMVFINRFSMDMLKVTDFNIGYKTKKEIKDAEERAKTIINKK